MMDQTTQQTKVGIGVLIFKDGKVLMSQRKGSHGAGAYAYPGGHLEYMESFENCARRETKEECGIEIDNIRFGLVANITAFTPKHYVHINLTADWKNGEPKTLEPEKATEWKWYALNELPEPLFETCQIAFDSLKTGRTYYDVQK